jgi:hypothetical protein
MSREQVKKLIRQGWDSVINPIHTIEIEEENDFKGRTCLLITLSGSIDQFKICPLTEDWKCLEGNASWIENPDRYWHLWANQDTLERNVMDIIWMLGDRLLRAEFGLD